MYNCKDFDYKKKDYEQFIGKKVHITTETVQPLDTNWAKKVSFDKDKHDLLKSYDSGIGVIANILEDYNKKASAYLSLESKSKSKYTETEPLVISSTLLNRKLKSTLLKDYKPNQKGYILINEDELNSIKNEDSQNGKWYYFETLDPNQKEDNTILYCTQTDSKKIWTFNDLKKYFGNKNNEPKEFERIEKEKENKKSEEKPKEKK